MELRNEINRPPALLSRKMWRFSCLPDGHHGGAGALLDTCEQTPNVVYGIGNNLNEQSTSPSSTFGFWPPKICDRPVVFQWENCAMPASLRAGQSRAVPQI